MRYAAAMGQTRELTGGKGITRVVGGHGCGVGMRVSEWSEG
jgi:hypothetical protein